MKKLINLKRVLRVLMILSIVMIVQSCAVYQPYSQTQVPVTDILQMSKDGLSSKDIIGQIRQTHSVYGLNADELAKLRDEGVADSVINYMEKTHFDAINQSRYYPNYGYDGGFGYYGDYGFGWPYYGWGWGFGPTIIYRNYGGFRGGGGFHGGFHEGHHGDRH